MHAPDGFLDAPTAAALGVVAVAGVGVSIRRAGVVLDERKVPLAGLTAAFVFAAQMLNFPVAGGTSGHLMGGVLAAVLLGPWLGALCVTVVVVVQAVVFADGGLTVLGLNVTTMALATALGGYAVFALLVRWLPARPPSVVAASGIAAGVSVVLSALVFTAAFAIGGSDAISLATLVSAMVGVHVLIGIGEGIITGLTVSAVMASRPDLVWGARHLPSSGDPRATVQLEAAR